MVIELTTIKNTNDIKIIYSDITYQNIMQLPSEEILNLFKLFGILLFRNFGVNYEQMKSFTAKLSSQIVIDPTKTNVESNDNWLIQIADEGTHSIAAHRENGSTPFVSDVLWFCCVLPAKDGGETLLWNGVRLWEHLSEPLKRLFYSKKIKYSRNIHVDTWKEFLGLDSTITDVKQMLDNFEGVTYCIQEDDSIDMEYICSAVIKTNYDEQEAFVNSLVYEYGRERVTFEDGSPIPDTVIEEIKSVMDKFTEAIPWQAGDLVMIDNSKFLHGRPSFNDKNRNILTIQTNI
jgi:alpha-ketoglutarate-dependent taurine dioxygenase